MATKGQEMQKKNDKGARDAISAIQTMADTFEEQYAGGKLDPNQMQGRTRELLVAAIDRLIGAATSCKEGLKPGELESGSRPRP